MRHINLVVLLALAWCACQEPVEPDLSLVGVGVLIRVVDQGGNGVPDLKVRYGPEESGDRLPFGTATDGNGEIRTSLDVPIGGVDYWFDVFGRTASGSDTAIVTGRRFHLGCRDSTYEIPIRQCACVRCADAWTFDDENLSATLCTGGRVLCSRVISFDCDSVRLDITRANDIDGAVFFRMPGNVPLPIGPSGIILDNAGDTCLVCMNYQARPPKASGTTSVSIEATVPGRPRQRLFNVKFTGITSCDSCNCPLMRSVRHPSVGADTLCSDTTERVTVKLDSVVRNTNNDCDLDVRIIGGPRAGDVKIVSFNGGSSLVSPGRSLGALDLSITPSAAGKAIDDEILVAVRTRSKDGFTTPCDTLRVGLHFYMRPLPCPLTLGGNLIASQSPLATGPIDAVVCGSDGNALRLGNPSPHCRLRIFSIAIVGPDAGLFSVDNAAPFAIPETSATDVHVTFAPTRDVYVNSGNPRRAIYTASLVIRSVCGTTTLPLTGRVSDPFAVPARLFTYGCPVDSNTAFYVLDNGSINTSQDRSRLLVITVSSVNTAAAPRTAVVNFGQPYALAPVVVDPNRSFCALSNDPSVMAACEGARSTGRAGTQTVREGELYVLVYLYRSCPFCALIWVEQIDPAGPTRPCPQVQFRICSPIVL